MINNLPERSIMCIDMRSFYASCMAVLAELNVMETPIAIVGNLAQPGSVVLAASPPMKKRFGIKTGARLYEIPRHPDIRIFEPKMAYFMKMSMAITRLLHQFVPQESIHVYSVDESFVDLTGTEKIWGPPEETACHIKEMIQLYFHIPSAVGMGPNMLMAKLALDIEAKNTDFAVWTYEDVREKLWPVKPLTKMWGIGTRMEKRLNDMGIFSVGDLANANLKELEKKFGIMGNQLYYHAHGLDLSDLDEASFEKPKSYGKGQILMRDYDKKEDVLAVILEMCEEVARRAREAFHTARCISLGVSYSKYTEGTGFHKAKTIDEPTNDTMVIYEVCKQLFEVHYTGFPVRRLSVTISQLESEYSLQLSFFDGERWKRRKLGHTMDALRAKYGATSVLRAVSYTEAGTTIQRNALLGGHKK